MPARRLRGPLTAALIALASVALLAVPAAPAAAQDGAARELAERYAPVVVVRDQDAPCDTDGEPDRPVPVETVLDAQGVLLRDGTGAVVKEAPGMADITGRGPETSLDFNGNPRRPGCTFEQDFDRLGAGRPDVAYAHVATDPAAPGRLALQYWFFWYFDDYVNTHEGDWEFVQLVWDAPTAEEALRTAPVEAGYSQHSGGERADWDGGKLERRGDHPVVYAAAGSHANFYTADLFLGRNADEGFGCDDARPPGTALQTQARLLPSGEVNPQGPDAWLLFQGRWGEFQKPPYDAPPGPRTKEEWSEPIVWQESLRDGSVAVPSGTTLGPTATGAFCAVVNAGGKIYTAITSPLVLVLIVVGLVMTGTAAARSTVWAPHVPHPLRRTRAAGQMLGAARGVYRERRRVLLPIGLLFLPAAVLEVALQQVVLELTPLGDLTAVAGRSSLVSIALALFVAGAGHVLAATVVVGGVALVMDAAERGGGVEHPRGLPADRPGGAPPAADRDPRGRHRRAARRDRRGDPAGRLDPRPLGRRGPGLGAGGGAAPRGPCAQPRAGARPLVAHRVDRHDRERGRGGERPGGGHRHDVPHPAAARHDQRRQLGGVRVRDAVRGGGARLPLRRPGGPPPGRQSPASSSVTPIRSSRRRTSGDRLRTRIVRPDETAASCRRSSARTPEESMNATCAMSISMGPEVAAASSVTRRTSDSPPAMSSSPFRA